MGQRRQSWRMAWWVGGGLLVVPLFAWLALDWLTPQRSSPSPSIPVATVPSVPAETAPASFPHDRAAPRGSTTTAEHFESADPTEVWGVVVDGGGQPVGGALVWCSEHEPGDPAVLSGSTSGDGRFTLPAEASGCRAAAMHPRLGESSPVRLRASYDNVLELTAGAVIEGVVVDEQGRPITAYTIGIESFRPPGGVAASGARGFERGRMGEHWAVSDEAGAFVVRGLIAGQYILAASAPGRPPTQSEGIDLASGEREPNVRLVLALGGTVRGSVVDAETAEPVAGARVMLDGLTTTRGHASAPAETDSDGRYELSGVPPSGPFSVRITAPQYRSQVRAGLSTQGNAELELDVKLSPVGEGGAGTEYTGIGAALAARPAGVVIGWVLEGGPAASAGVRQDDRIVRIDGEAAAALTVPQCVQRLRGPVATRVTLTLQREDEAPFDVIVTRGSFTR